MTSSRIKIGNYRFAGSIPRKNFSKTADMVSLPDLISVQSKSFNDLVQLDFLPHERQSIGIEKVLRDTFPISHGDVVSLEFVSYELGNWACVCGAQKGIEMRYTLVCDSCGSNSVGRLTKGMRCSDCSSTKLDYKKCDSCRARVTLQVSPSAANCKHSGKTFSLPLKIRLKLVTYEPAENSKNSPVIKDIKVQDVFFCSFPVMVDNYNTEDGTILVGSKGTFVVNGIDRVVVSQIHRAPGVLFVGNKKSKDFRGNPLPSARLIPARGVWLDFEFDSKDLLWVKVDKKRKLLVSTFLQALGYSPEEAISQLYKTESIFLRDGVFSRPVDQSLIGYKICQGDLSKKLEATIPVGSKIDSQALAALKKAGLNKLEVSREALVGKWASKRLFDSSTGELILEVGDVLSIDHVNRLLEMDEAEIHLIDSTEYQVVPSVALCFGNDSVDNYQKAVAELYSRLRSGDLPGHEVMVKSIEDALHNPRFYDLSRVGRLRINRKLETDTPAEVTVLTRQDIIATIKYLLGIKERAVGVLDNPDHLANRCVRLVGELIQNQVYIAFSRIERIIRERFRLQEISQSTMPYDFVNVKPLAAVLNSFFGTGQLSQFMDQTNPLAEMAHKRRLSALGPGGLQRESASLEVRDVQPSHYGRICTIETPDGANIGLISSLASYATVNSFGLLETPYRIVENGKIKDECVLLDAYQESGKVIVQAKVQKSADGKITSTTPVLARRDEDFVSVLPSEVDYCDASPQQLVSVATALIPFLENDDANRALMGSNMQRQAVPVVQAEPPIVATGMEFEVGCSSPVVLRAKSPGVVKFVSSEKIVVEIDSDYKGESDWIAHPVDVYNLSKFERSSHNTWVTQSPIVRVGDRVERGTVLCNGSSVVDGELALGRNALVAIMPMDGYNFEDAIAISERMVSDDVFTSVHIEEFTVEARDTKLGAEEITKDIPNLSEKEIESLDEDGIVLVGTRVSPGNILVGKVTLKGDVQVSAEEKLLRAIFGEKSREVRDTSARVPPGISGTVVDVKVFSRSGIRKDARYKEYVDRAMKKIDQDLAIELDTIQSKLRKDVISIIRGSGSATLKKLDTPELESMPVESLLKLGSKNEKIKNIVEAYKNRLEIMNSLRAQQLSSLRKGDDLPSGVLKMVRVYIAMKRHISVGDKMVGRHGNKGVVSKIFKIEDMPYLEDGTPVDIVVNPIGCPGRMNLGQILETMFGMACKKLGSEFAKSIQEKSDQYCRDVLADFLGKETVADIEKVGGMDEVMRIARIFAKRGFHVKTPVFDGANYDDVQSLLAKANLPKDGKSRLFDGRTGLPFQQRVMVGYMYMMKLNHMVDDKVHARSVGPYSLITQQPLGGKAQGGGQRLGEMEVWALMAYGAAYTLQEMLTIKSDDIVGRSKAYDSLVHGDEVPAPGLPESFNVLVKELQSLGLQVDLFEADRGLIQ